MKLPRKLQGTPCSPTLLTTHAICDCTGVCLGFSVGALLTESMAEDIAGKHKVGIFCELGSFCHLWNKGSEPSFGSHINSHPVICNPLPSINTTCGPRKFISNPRNPFHFALLGDSIPSLYTCSIYVLTLLQIWDH